MESLNDNNIRLNLVGIMTRKMESTLNGIELPGDDPVGVTALGKLTEAGCDSNFVLQTTWIYAMLQWGLEENRKVEATTHVDYRKSQFVGRSFTRKQARKHVAGC